jgi:thiol-disulfide isomerase/thioredoxin
MALTESNMLPLGTIAPDFALPNTIDDKIYTFGDIASDKGTVVMFLCNHCPYVVYINTELVRLAKEYQAKGIAFVAISSNDAQKYPADAPDKMKIHAQEVGYPFAYLYDESQDVARAYDAACTPDFYVFDGQHRLAYRGQLDDARPSAERPITGKDLRAALDNVLANAPVPAVQRPSAGCNIKWKPK